MLPIALRMHQAAADKKKPHQFVLFFHESKLRRYHETNSVFISLCFLYLKPMQNCIHFKSEHSRAVKRIRRHLSQELVFIQSVEVCVVIF